MALINWLLIPRNTALLTLIGFWIGVIGLGLTLLGLFFTLRQLKLIKTESEATTAAIESVQLKVSSFDFAKECHLAHDLILQIRESYRSQDWTSLLTSYEKLIESFLKLSHSHSAVLTDDKLLLIKMTQDMANICNGIRRKILSNEANVMPRGHDQAIRNFSDILIKVTTLVARDLQK